MNPSNVYLDELKEDVYALIEKICESTHKCQLKDLKNKGQFLGQLLKFTKASADNKFFNSQLRFESLSKKSFDQFKEYFATILGTKNLPDEVYQNLLADFAKLEPKLAAKFNTPNVDSHLKYSKIIKHVYGRIPTAFYNSKWWLYERHGDDAEEIGRKVLIFRKTQDNKVLSVTMLPFKENSHEWIGEAKFLSGDNFLIITLFNTEGFNDFVHFTVKVHNRTSELSLSIGHMTLKHTTQNNVVTRTVVLEKTTDDTKNIKARRFSLQEELVPFQIREFLADRRLNRLPSPHQKEITSLDTLAKWLNQNKYVIDKMYAKLSGKYRVYYKQNVESKVKDEAQKLTQDSLTLTALKNNQMSVSYQHGIDIDEAASNWKGLGFINHASHTFHAYLKGPLENLEDATAISNRDSKPTFFLIDVPSYIPGEIDVLVGIATAPRDEDKGSVARLIVLFKDTIETNLQTLESFALEFFDIFQNKMRVRPPSNTKIYNIKTFKKTIENLR